MHSHEDAKKELGRYQRINFACHTTFLALKVSDCIVFTDLYVMFALVNYFVSQTPKTTKGLKIARKVGYSKNYIIFGFTSEI